jgi:hypothetical protein
VECVAQYPLFPDVELDSSATAQTQFLPWLAARIDWNAWFKLFEVTM